MREGCTAAAPAPPRLSPPGSSAASASAEETSAALAVLCAPYARGGSSMLIEPYATAVRPHPQLVSGAALCPDPASSTDALTLFTPWNPTAMLGAAAAAGNPYAAAVPVAVPQQQQQQTTALFRHATPIQLRTAALLQQQQQQLLMKLDLTQCQTPIVSIPSPAIKCRIGSKRIFYHL
ncbi:hypothetical protein TNCV_3503971 [Trichonephila clavipes]|uniref:Uncharacterized protein n=1 Tax=Trichonephila clavipes TaxID=2585209 RepID=A0A8X6S448_TRICX|nr:hypothetical protein TNCV_3503971 [Trichonephila clavipes]